MAVAHESVLPDDVCNFGSKRPWLQLECEGALGEALGSLEKYCGGGRRCSTRGSGAWGTGSGAGGTAAGMGRNKRER